MSRQFDKNKYKLKNLLLAIMRSYIGNLIQSLEMAANTFQEIFSKLAEDKGVFSLMGWKECNLKKGTQLLLKMFQDKAYDKLPLMPLFLSCAWTTIIKQVSQFYPDVRQTFHLVVPHDDNCWFLSSPAHHPTTGHQTWREDHQCSEGEGKYLPHSAM